MRIKLFLRCVGPVSIMTLTLLLFTQASQSKAENSSGGVPTSDYYQSDWEDASSSSSRIEEGQGLLAAAPDYQYPVDYVTNQDGTAVGYSDALGCDTLSCDGGSCCDGCGSSSCCGNCQSRYVVATVEAVFLSPNLKNGQGVSYSVTPTGGSTTLYTTEGTDDLYVSPRVWMGLQGAHWGAGVRYWNLSSSESNFAPLVTGSTTGSTGSDRLDMQVLDFEATRRFYRGCTDLTFAIGFRHLEFENQNSVSGIQTVGADLYSGSAYAASDVDANGLTIALSGVRPVGCSGKWNLFWNVRGSVLWGDTLYRVQTYSSVVGPGGAANSVNGAIGASSNEAIFIGELQLGLEREYQLKCIPATAFVRGALEYQYWDSNGTGSAFSISNAARPSGIGTATATTASLDMDMIGFTLGAGVYW